MSVSLIIPAFNEERNLSTCIETCMSHLSHSFPGYEIIIVNDGSKDRTSQVASSFTSDHVRVLDNLANYGKGYSVRRGVLEATQPIIAYTDADLPTPITALDELVLKINRDQFDIAIASRQIEGAILETPRPFHRALFDRLFHLSLRAMSLTELHDTQCGLKAFRSDVALTLFRLSQITGFAFDAEILYLSNQKGYKISEVPIKWHDREPDRADSISQAVRMLADVIRLRFRR